METEREAIERQALERLRHDIGGEIVGRRLMPIGDHLARFIRQEHLTCEVVGEWYAVNAEPRHERMAASSITDAGLPAYLPMVTKQERHGRGASRNVERPMFGSYLFARCRMTDDNWRKITSARGVHRLLDVTGNGKPVPVPSAAIDVIRAVEAEAGTQRGKSRLIWHFTEGDICRIKDGPFSGFYAQLQSAVDEHERIRALVDIFGRKTLVTFDASQLEAP